ncbi:MAG: hypothetical protein AB3N63_04265 [Puniceicoccaceae bacterium]
MKPILPLVLVLLTAFSSLLHAAQEDPFKLFDTYALKGRDAENKLHAIIGFEDGFPQLVTPKGLLKSPKKFIQIRPTKAVNDRSIEIISMEESRQNNQVVLDLFLKSSHGLRGVYATLSYKPPEKNFMCKVAQVPVLTGQPQNIKLKFQGKGVPKKGLKLTFYHQGRALYDPNAQGMKKPSVDQVYQLQFVRHKAMVGKGDSNPAPFYMPVSLPDPSMLPKGKDPVVIKAKISIQKNGKVGKYSFPEDTDPALVAHLSQNIDNWRFFPRIKEGQTVPVTISVPLKLR